MKYTGSKELLIFIKIFMVIKIISKLFHILSYLWFFSLMYIPFHFTDETSPYYEIKVFFSVNPLNHSFHASKPFIFKSLVLC